MLPLVQRLLHPRCRPLMSTNAPGCTPELSPLRSRVVLANQRDISSSSFANPVYALNGARDFSTLTSGAASNVKSFHDKVYEYLVISVFY
jgi:hypothetical protein